MGSPVRVMHNGPMMEITLDRPKANAIDVTTSRLMSDAFEDFRDDPNLRVAILTGAGDRFFTAGWDLSAAAAGEDFESDYGPGGFGGFGELPGLNKPIIVAINGMAVGGGFEMAMAADLVVAADHAEFFLPETAVGIIPDVGTVRLPRLLPRQLATEILIAGKRLSAHDAQRWGLVNTVIPRAELMDAARELAGRVIDSAPLAVIAILDLVQRTRHLSIPDALAAMRSGHTETYETMLASDDAREGPESFIEKRRVNWKGR